MTGWKGASDELIKPTTLDPVRNPVRCVHNRMDVPLAGVLAGGWIVACGWRYRCRDRVGWVETLTHKPEIMNDENNQDLNEKPGRLIRLPAAPCSAKCKHRKTWMICGGFGEWCYECGAFRGLRQVAENSFAARTTWVRPVGVGGENPYSKMRDLSLSNDKRR